MNAVGEVMNNSGPYIPLCLFDDGNFLHGSHVALLSAVKNCSKPLRIYFFHNALDPTKIDLLKETCALAGGIESFRTHGVDLRRFSDFRALVGNRFAYARLMIGDLVFEKKCIYIDSDVIVNLDLAELFDFPLDQNIIGALEHLPVGRYLEKDFFRSIGCHDDMPIFNSGVLLIDLDSWRAQAMTERCLAFGRQHSGHLKTADQTILNGVLQGVFKPLPQCYNFAAYAGRSQAEAPERAILHFIGSPKPWDPFGGYLHGFSKAFADLSARTAYPLSAGGFSFGRLKRLVRIAPACFRLFRKMRGF